MNRYIRVLTLLLLICASTFIKAQVNYNFHTVSMENGLSSNMVNDVMCDSKGFVWIATSYGLNRYDGVHIRQYFKDYDTRNICNNRFWSVAEDGNGMIWVGVKYKDYTLYNTHDDSFDCDYIGYLKKLGLKKVPKWFELYVDEDRNLWLKTNDAVLYYHFKSKAWKRFDFTDVSSMSVKAGKAYFICNDLTILVVNLKNGKLSKDLWLHDKYKIYGDDTAYIYGDSYGDIWAYDSKHKALSLKDKKSGEWHEFVSGVDCPQPDIYKITEDPVGRILFAMGNSSLCYYDTYSKTIKQIDKDASNLPSGNISMVYSTKRSVWVCYERKGVAFAIKPIEGFIGHFSWDDTIKERNSVDIQSIIQTHDNKLWFATHGNGIFVCNFDEKTKYVDIFRNISIENEGNYVTTLFEDRYHNVWALTKHDGVYIFKSYDDPNPRHIKKGENGLEDYEIIDAAEDANGYLWVCTKHNGVQQYDAKKGHFDKPLLPKTPVFDLMMSNYDHLLYIATSDGYSVISPKDNKVCKCRSYRSNDEDINQVYFDSRGWLWLGGVNGLMVQGHKDDKMLRVGKKEGLKCHNIHGIVEDKQHNMWISTEYGLIRITLPEGAQTPRLRDFHIQNFSRYDGLKSQSFNPGAMMIMSNGTVLAGSIDGACAIHPDKVTKYRNNKGLYITELHIGSDSVCAVVDTCKTYNIKYNDRLCKIRFSTLDGSPAYYRRYAYRLHEEDQWTFTAHNEATFTHLIPGDYTFEVCFAGDDEKNITRLRIHVNYPWWVSWWAILIYIIGVLGLVLLWRRSHTQRKNLLNSISDMQKDAKIAMERYQNALIRAEEKHNDADDTNTDADLLRRATELIIKNIDDSDFTVEMLSKELGMSRASLHRKLVAITGNGPLGFIRSVKLKHAKHLLEKGNKSVAEVAYAVGYNSPKLFTKYFKEEFGVVPSQVKN